MKTKLPRNAFWRVALFTIIPLLAILFMYIRMNAALRGYMESRTARSAELLGDIVSQELDDHLKNLEQVAAYLKDGSITEEQMPAFCERFLENPARLSCGILRLDGTPVFGDALRPSEYPAVKKAFQGNSAIRYRKGEGFLFTTAIYNGDNIKYALYEFFDPDALLGDFKQKYTLEGTEVILADSSQQLIIPLSPSDDVSVFTSDGTAEYYSEINEKIGAKSTAASFFDDGGGHFWFISDIPQNNIFLVGRVPYALIAENLSGMTIMVLVVFLLLLALLVMGTFSMLNSLIKLRESDELRAAKQIAEEASRSKSTFLANMSHELRTPINVILGMDEMILREETKERTRERAMDIRSAAQILMSLINDVLDYSKIESGKMNIIRAEYNLAAMIRDLSLLTENRARQKSLDFRMNIDENLPVTLYGDDIHIMQVLTNLLTNAVKYTNEGSVTLEISGEKTSENKMILHCSVKDTGIGIKQEDIDKLMIPYTRIEEARNRTVEGTGLGMSIIINLLKLMGSRLNIESVYGEGSTFWFDLEQETVGGELMGDIEKRLGDMIKEYEYKTKFIAPEAEILMVDDNSMNRKIFESLLTETKISVKTLSSGAKCLEEVAEKHYDIIFMDHLMPEMDGIETLRRMKALENNLCKDTPVVMLTANAFTGDRKKYLSDGFDEFLSKPIVTDKLEELIKRLLPPEYIKDPPVEPPKKDINEPPEELPEVDGVNRDFASLHFKQRDMFKNMLRDFYDNIDSEAEQLSYLFEGIENDEGLKNYRIRVHALKSTAATVGIMSVSELAKLLEFAAREGNTEKIALLAPVLSEELQKTKQRLHAFFGDDKEKIPLPDSALLKNHLESLKTAVAAMDIGTADAVMREINKYYYEQNIEEIISRLREKTASLDYGAAANIIEEALSALS